MTKEELIDLFERTEVAGTTVKVTSTFVALGGNQRSRRGGYAFVNFATHDEAAAVKEKYDGDDFKGRQLRLDFDIGKDRKERQYYPSGTRGGAGGRSSQSS